jgi:elongator complex protein 1
VELWDLRTRLEPGRSKAMDPKKVWEGFLGEECRQVKLLSTTDQAQDRVDIKIAVLGSTHDGCDIITFTELEDWKAAAGSRPSRMPGHSGRLVDSDSTFVWQARDGELFTSVFFDH